MAYQVIARKWRPKTFDDLVGQNHITQSLKNAITSDRLPHALLFTGPRGTGKTSCARVLARMLRSPEPKTPEEKREAQLIFEGRSLDVLEIDGASNNGVDAVRDLREGVKYKPSSGQYKIYIIDEVHMLSTPAFNALLKTLEEPPEHVVFILATTEVHKIPQTILSRCQRFDFRRIATKEIAERLKLICEKDGIEAHDNALWIIARQGDGSMRDSQSLLDQVITFANNDLSLDSVTTILGLTDRSLLIDTLSSLVRRDKKLMLGLIQRISEAGYDPKLYAQDLLEELRHLLLTKLGVESLDLPDAEIALLEELSQEISEEEVHFLFDMALKGAEDIPRSSDPGIVLEMLLLRMVAAPKLTSLAALFRGEAPSGGNSSSAPTGGGSRNLGNGAGTLGKPGLNQAQGPEPKSQSLAKASVQKLKAEPASSANPPGELQQTGALKSLDFKEPGTPQQKWDRLVELIRGKNPIFAAKLTAFVLGEVTNDKIVLGIPTGKKLLSSQLQDPQVHQQLRDFAKELLDEAFVIEILEGPIPDGESLQQHQDRTKKSKTAEANKQVNEHPLVRSAKEVFNSEIVEIKDLKN